MSDQHLSERLQFARDQAKTLGLPTRRKDGDLYRLLSLCLALCEEVERDSLQEELRKAVRVSIDQRNPELIGQGRSLSNNGKGRRYTESSSDTYVLVSRFVLEQTDTRNTIYRYAKALREAARRRIRSTDLPGWLSENGGIRMLTHGSDRHNDTYDHPALRRLWRKLQVMQLDAKTPSLQEDISEVMALVTLVAQGMGFDTKTCRPLPEPTYAERTRPHE